MPTPTTLSIAVQREYFERNSNIELRCYASGFDDATDRSGQNIEVNLLSHTKGTDQDHISDPVIDGPTNLTSDKSGQSMAYWNCGPFPYGVEQKYYARATWGAVTGYSRDFSVLNTDELLLYELDMVLADLQRIPVRNELALDVDEGTSYHFTSHLLRDDAPIRFRANSTSLGTSDISTIDYDNGILTLAQSHVAGTAVELESGFRKLFSNDQLYNFLELALSDANMILPQTAYAIDAAPGLWRSFIVQGGQVAALNTTLTNSSLQEQIAIFGGVQAIVQLQGVAASVQARVDSLKPTLKKRFTTGLVVTSHDTGFPPRVTAATFSNYLYARFGR